MRRFAVAVLAFGVAMMAAPAARAQQNPSSDPGPCINCHHTQSVLAAGEDGHTPLISCPVCHEDRRPGIVGPGHRSIPASCTGHHTTMVETHPEPKHPLRPRRLRQTCLACHDPHGSHNAMLIHPAIRTSGRLRAIDFQDAGGAVPGGFVDPMKPGHGLCEVCHRHTKFYRANGHGQPHYTEDCTLCHDHTAAFNVVITDASCPSCHQPEATHLAQASLHHDKFSGRCSACHAEVNPQPGPGHRATSSCSDCHSASQVAAHMPPGNPIPCAQCHEPHGTQNIRLIRDVIHTTPGADKPIHFDNVIGLADGSFASASQPGTGLCEVCHTTTRHYRADGTGSPHYTDDCTRCHEHAQGFDIFIQVSDATCPVCHQPEADNLAEPSRHHDIFTGKCSRCHAEVTPQAGPGHRAIAACGDCHSPSQVAAHTPPGVNIPCAQCHEPHGSQNIRLIRQIIQTAQGPNVPIRFDNLTGRADGSFVSASQPGTGLCEVCHTTTNHYQADGGGSSHYTSTCTNCHDHADGFEP